jgi:ribosomal protein S18 acetylase RimI-like enzyme
LTPRLPEPDREVDEALRLRPIRDDDRGFLRRLYGSTRQEELAAVDWIEEEKERFLDFQFAAQHDYYQEQFPDASFDLVLVAGEPVGRLYVDRRADEIRLIDIALLPDSRRRGIGGRLMSRVLDEGRAAGLPVQIHVEQNNPAMRLYDRLGFERVEEQGVYWLMRWEPNG